MSSCVLRVSSFRVYFPSHRHFGPNAWARPVATSQPASDKQGQEEMGAQTQDAQMPCAMVMAGNGNQWQSRLAAKTCESADRFRSSLCCKIHDLPRPWTYFVPSSYRLLDTE